MSGLTQMSYALDRISGRRQSQACLLLDAVGNTQVDPREAMGSAHVVYSIGKLVCFHFRCTTHNCYDRISLPIHPGMGTGLSTYRIKGTGREVLAVE